MNSHHLHPGYPWFYPDNGDTPFPVDLHYHITYGIQVGLSLFPGVILLALGEIFKASPGYRNGVPPLQCKAGNADGIESNPFFII